MLKILIPVDTTKVSSYAIKHAIHRVWTGEALDIHLLYVEPRLSRFVGRFVARTTDPGARALKAAGELLERGGLRYSAHASHGNPAQQIVRYAESNRFGGILMASARLGSISEMVLGSVTAKVLRTSRIPVEVVPASPRSRLRAYAGPIGVGASIGALIYVAIE
jgi:nucleotide-binding universal stress UspA family protein